MSRGRGEGSVYYHEKLNLWCASITIYVASKRKRRTAYAHSQKEAINKLDALRQRPDAPRATENVAAYLDRWLALIEREREIKPRSLAKHEQRCRLHIKPVLGQLKLAKLRSIDIQEFIAAAELAPRSVAGLRDTMHKAFKRAVALRLARSQPSHGYCRSAGTAQRRGAALGSPGGAIAQDR